MFNSAWNPPNRFDGLSVEWEEEPPKARLEIHEDQTRGVVAHNDSPDIGFDWSVNPYRGCTHACAYCYARPFHELLGWGAGSDFERRIVVKTQAPALLEAHLRKPSWKGELIAFSGVTDCYQPLERRYELTRRCLRVCARYRQPVSIITRSPLIVRDVDILRQLHEHRAVGVTFSIPILDPQVARAIEPGAPSPQARLGALAALAHAGIPVGISVGPVIPGLSDRDLPETLRLARQAGASWAWPVALRLPGAVAQVFEARLRERLPERADTILRRVQRMRDGRMNDPAFGTRMRGGTDPSWQAVRQLFDLWHRKLGFSEPWRAPDPSPFHRPGEGHQLGLF